MAVVSYKEKYQFTVIDMTCYIMICLRRIFQWKEIYYQLDQ